MFLKCKMFLRRNGQCPSGIFKIVGYVVVGPHIMQGINVFVFLFFAHVTNDKVGVVTNQIYLRIRRGVFFDTANHGPHHTSTWFLFIIKARHVYLLDMILAFNVIFPGIYKRNNYLENYLEGTTMPLASVSSQTKV